MRCTLIRLLAFGLLSIACRPSSVLPSDASPAGAPDAALDAGTPDPTGPTGATGAVGGWFEDCTPDASIPCESCNRDMFARVLAGAAAFDCGGAPVESQEARAVRNCAAQEFLRRRPFVATLDQHSTDTDGTEVFVGRADGGLSLLTNFSLGSPGFTLIEADCTGATVLDGGGYLALSCPNQTFCRHCGSCPW